MVKIIYPRTASFRADRAEVVCLGPTRTVVVRELVPVREVRWFSSDFYENIESWSAKSDFCFFGPGPRFLKLF